MPITCGTLDHSRQHVPLMFSGLEKICAVVCERRPCRSLSWISGGGSRLVHVQGMLAPSLTSSCPSLGETSVSLGSRPATRLAGTLPTRLFLTLRGVRDATCRRQVSFSRLPACTYRSFSSFSRQSRCRQGEWHGSPVLKNGNGEGDQRKSAADVLLGAVRDLEDSGVPEVQASAEVFASELQSGCVVVGQDLSAHLSCSIAVVPSYFPCPLAFPHAIGAPFPVLSLKH